MNTGIFGEGFPYSNFHDLNMDWIIKIAKDFLDQYTHIQQIIADGETSLINLTDSGLEQLQDKANALEALLQAWYNEHSEDIANQLASALADLGQALLDTIAEFNRRADAKAEQTIESIPDDYTSIYNDLENLKSASAVKSNITNMIVSANNNYLDATDINISGKYIKPNTGVLTTDSSYSCGYIRFPCAGTYKLHSSVAQFGNNRLYIPLFYGDKTYYKSLEATAVDNYIVEFTLSEEDAELATYIGVSTRPNTDPSPMLILNNTYPAGRTYVKPTYNFSDLLGLRNMGIPTVTNLNNIINAGWYQRIGASSVGTWTNLPDDYANNISSLIVFTNAYNNNYCIQILIDSSTKQNTWIRYVNRTGTDASDWKRIHNSETYSIIELANEKRFINSHISLSGNYFDFNNAEWISGFDNGTEIVTTDGYYHAYVMLPGAGHYVRMMRYGTFGAVCERISLYNANKQRIKMITASRVGTTNGFEFTLSEEDAKTALYTTVNYMTGYEYYSALFYESNNFPLPAGKQAGLPNFNPVNDPLYKSVFVCDGDSICEGSKDLPEEKQGWWGRISLDYSTTGENYADGGATITSGLYYDGGSARHWINESIDTIYAQHPNLKYLILEGGTNDADIIGEFNGDTPPQNFGTWSETNFTGSYNNNTFCGAVETMFYKATTYFPNAKIGFIIAMEMGRSSTVVANRRRYFDEIKAIANKWHIPVLDLWNECHADARLTAYYDSSMTGAENVTAKKFYFDGQHPTSYGYNLMQDMIADWIHTL